MKRRRLCGYLLAGAVLCCLAPPSAHAQGLPAWRIAEICAKDSAPGQCSAFEGQALRAVSASWQFVLDPIRRTCLEQTKLPSNQSWRLLAECLDGETAKALDRAAVLTARTPAEPVPPPAPPAPPSAQPSMRPPPLQIEIPPAPELKPQ